MPEPCLDVEAMEEGNAKEQQMQQPWTPKRASEEGGGGGADVAPAKTARQTHLGSDQPTNCDLMQFMVDMKASQESSMRSVNASLELTETRLGSIEEQTSTRLDVTFEKTMQEQMEQISRQVREARAAAPTAPARGRASTCSAKILEPIVKIGGFDHETPRVVLEEARAKHIRPAIQPHFDTEVLGVRAPYMLSSQLWARFVVFTQAKLFLAALRKNEFTIKLGSNRIVTSWSTLHKPKEFRRAFCG